MPNTEKICEHCGAVYRRSPKGDAYHFARRRFCGPRCAATATSAQRRSVADRFWAKVDKSSTPDACWPWLGGHATAGYGVIGVDAWRVEGAHRVSYRLNVGEIPPGLEVCHHCDNPGCVNPDHLFAGTHAQNMHDSETKGRNRHPGLKGSEHPRAKLTEASVREIRQSADDPTTLAAQYGITRESIYMIRARKTWRHVE